MLGLVGYRKMYDDVFFYAEEGRPIRKSINRELHREMKVENAMSPMSPTTESADTGRSRRRKRSHEFGAGTVSVASTDAVVAMTDAKAGWHKLRRLFSSACSHINAFRYLVDIHEQQHLSTSASLCCRPAKSKTARLGEQTAFEGGAAFRLGEAIHVGA